MTLSRRTIAALTLMLLTACGGRSTAPTPPMPTEPTPAPTPAPAPTPDPAPVVTASAYILPGAVSLGDWAFGDEPVVIYRDEHLRWVNADALTHRIVADSPDATDFRQTDNLGPGGQQSFVMTKLGTTRIHCSIHPNMTGTLIVREH